MRKHLEPLPAGSLRPRRRTRPAPLRRAGVPRVPHVRGPGPRLHAASVRRLHLRAPPALLLQAARLLSQLWRTAHGGACSLPRRRGAATGAGAPVGPNAAVSPALRLGPFELKGGATGVSVLRGQLSPEALLPHFCGPGAIATINPLS